jgi:hypothetical protein
MITAFTNKNGYIFFFCFFIYSPVIAQIKLDDIKNKLVAKAEKEISILENKNPKIYIKIKTKNDVMTMPICLFFLILFYNSINLS